MLGSYHISLCPQGSSAADDLIAAGHAGICLEDDDNKVQANDEADQHLLSIEGFLKSVSEISLEVRGLWASLFRTT